MVLLSAQGEAPGAPEALSELCRIYWYPLYGFIRRRGHTPEEAQDLTQGFFLDLLERETLARVDPLKGKFRAFLLGALQHYLSTEATRARCIKRGGKVKFVYLDAEAAEDRLRLEPVNALTPEKVFDARWGIALLDEAMRRLHEEYVAQGKMAAFDALKIFLDVANSKELPAYEDAAKALRVSVGATKTLIHRLRKRYTALVREEVGRTLSNVVDVDAELHELCEALVATDGGITS